MGKTRDRSSSTTGPCFLASAERIEQLPQLQVPEIAILGRSNVGKSSFIRTLLGQRRLVRTSSTPGHTKTINLFRWNESLALVDLPGYGFAERSHAKRHEMAELLESYLEQRTMLAAVLLLDMRRESVSDLDLAMLEDLRPLDTRLFLVATKCDLVPKTQRYGRRADIAKQLGVIPEHVLEFSSKTQEGRQQLDSTLNGLVRLKFPAHRLPK